MRNREEKKCKKGQESTIGKIIYGFLLFMPLLAIFITCGYAIFNKNAYESTSNKNLITTSAEISRTGQLEDKKQYDFYLDITQGNTVVQYFKYYDISFNWEDYGAPSGHNYNSFGIYGNSQQTLYVYLRENDTNIYTFWNAYATFGENWHFSLTNRDNYTLSGNQAFNIYTFVFEKQTLDNVFYYSVDKVEQSNLFNWAQNSVIYTTTNATCNALSINNTFIPLLLSYWLIISVLYFLYDIALMLVWIVHRKIHDLQENF